MREQWVLEYSPSQLAFHIQLLDDAVRSNQRRFFNKPLELFDWQIVFVGSHRQCELMLVQAETRLAKRREDRQWTH
jgi:hypothetical protein